MSDIYQTGTKYKVARKNKVYAEGRNCLEKGCITILSKYNKFDYCSNHLPYRQARVRGATNLHGV
jgi:predicted  nucleic acid-binding Zn-ribbon protein